MYFSDNMTAMINMLKKISYSLKKSLLFFLTFNVIIIDGKLLADQVIYAVNCGGESHVDKHGIKYDKDTNLAGHSSDHGKNFRIRRIDPEDQILYQTERYHTDNFIYAVNIKEDGNYVLIMKFSEVWFTEANRKVFDVQLNGEHKVVDHLDIFSVAGLGIAHDEIVPFRIKNGELFVKDESSKYDGLLEIEFVKGYLDNPKINAIYIIKGKLEDVPQLPPLEFTQAHNQMLQDEEDDESSQEQTASSRSKRRKPFESSSKVIDPYATDDPSSMMIPVIIAIAAFIPIVFCLCKL